MSDKQFKLSFETVLQYKIMDNDTDLNESEVVDLLNKLYEENEQLKKSEKINMEYAEQIVEENQQLRIAKNDLRIENEQLHLAIDDLLSHTSCDEIKKENEQLQHELRGMDKLLKSYRETIKHDAELLADATRNGYLPPLDDFVKG